MYLSFPRMHQQKILFINLILENIYIICVEHQGTDPKAILEYLLIRYNNIALL